MLTPTSQVTLLGFGARAGAFAALLAPRGCALRAWDPGLAGEHAGLCRARIEAAGVDPVAEPSRALRGARLVVLDGIAMDAPLTSALQPGARVLDLFRASVPEVDAVLVALGMPDGTHWQAAWTLAQRNMANSPASPQPPPVRRGALP